MARSYRNGQASHRFTLRPLSLPDFPVIRQIAIYGYLSGNSGASIAIDRVILHAVNDDRACEEGKLIFSSFSVLGCDFVVANRRECIM